MYLPFRISEEARKRTHKCLGCHKLTDPSGEECCFCSRPISAEDRIRMKRAFVANREEVATHLLFPFALVAVVVWLLMGS